MGYPDMFSFIIHLKALHCQQGEPLDCQIEIFFRKE